MAYRRWERVDAEWRRDTGIATRDTEVATRVVLLFAVLKDKTDLLQGCHPGKCTEKKE